MSEKKKEKTEKAAEPEKAEAPKAVEAPAEAPKEAPKEAPTLVSAKKADTAPLAAEGGKREPAEAPAEAPKEAPKPVPPRKRRVALVHVYSSKNDTIVTATDLSGAETLAWASGGMMVKSDREEGRPYAAMQAALRVMSALKEKGIFFVHVKIRAPGGVGVKTPGPGAQAVVRTIARTGVRIGRIEDVTPLPTDSMKRKGGRRGRRV